MFLEKARIASKSGQKNLNLDIKDVVALSDSLATVMTRLAGKLDERVSTSPQETTLTVEMDGGGFK